MTRSQWARVIQVLDTAQRATRKILSYCYNASGANPRPYKLVAMPGNKTNRRQLLFKEKSTTNTTNHFNTAQELAKVKYKTTSQATVPYNFFCFNDEVTFYHDPKFVCSIIRFHWTVFYDQILVYHWIAFNHHMVFYHKIASHHKIIIVKMTTMVIVVTTVIMVIVVIMVFMIIMAITVTIVIMVFMVITVIMVIIVIFDINMVIGPHCHHGLISYQIAFGILTDKSYISNVTFS